MKGRSRPCQMDVIDRANSGFFRTESKRCPNRAKITVIAAGWKKDMCLVHGNPYRRAFWAGDRYITHVTEIAP